MDDSEEKPNASQDFASTKAAIFETFNKLKKWREEQVNQFRSMQFLESQKLIQLSDESQKQFEKLLQSSAKSPEPEKSEDSNVENSPSYVSGENDLEGGYNNLEDSSITGHMLRCFDDTSQSSISTNKSKIDFEEKSTPDLGSQCSEFTEKNLTENNEMRKNAVVKCSSGKPKRPFLKKGTGLLRYMPKLTTGGQASKTNVPSKSSNQLKRNIQLPQKTLKLKPAIRKTDIPSEHSKHIRFDIPSDSNAFTNESTDESVIPVVPVSVINSDENSCDESPKSPVYNDCERDKQKDLSSPESENLNLENKELQQFEMLEKYAQNSSFNSDSSVIQRVLQGETTKSSKISQKPIPESSAEIFQVRPASTDTNKSSESSIFSPKYGLSKCLEEVKARKQILQKVISDINPRIQSLQKEIYSSKQEALDDSDISERCSTPIENLSTDDKILSPALRENEPNLDLSDLATPSVSENNNIDYDCHANCKCCNLNDVLGDLYTNQDKSEKGENSELLPQNDQVLSDRKKIREKLQELENEIEIYQEHNAKLSKICKERDEILRKLQKEHDDFNKYKESEKKKLDAEIQEERKQIRRQKETFMRYQKLRKDHPTRKERDELNTLRQEVEKLQEELKRQKIKHTNDCRRLKTQLDAAEKERDSFKLENIRLEEQCQDLLAALKTRMKKMKLETNSLLLDKAGENARSPEVCKDAPEQKETTSIQEKESDSDGCKDLNQVISKTVAEQRPKAKVRFNLVSEPEKDKLEHVETCLEKEEITLQPKPLEEYLPEKECEPAFPNENSKRNSQAVNLSTISVSVEAEFKEINLGNKVERIYTSGEREIIFQSGTKKVISADGQSIKFNFYNGDTKEIFPDKRETYRYVSGVTETRFLDGLEVTEFPNGQVQRRYPDGQKEVKFPDGTTHNIYADGSEEIHSADGNVVRLSADGTETIEFANGQKEIRTATYKRREFPDGSVKIIYDSGRQETRYSNGRIRIKDKEGKVIVDTKYLGVVKG